MLTHRTRSILGDIPDDWDVREVRGLTEKQFSGDWGDDDGEQAVTVIRSTNFTKGGQLDLTDVATRYFSEQKAATFGLHRGDVIVERSGGGPEQPVGRIGFIDVDMPGAHVSNFVQVLRSDPEEVDPAFLGWALYELQRTGIVERVQQQSTQMRNLNWRDYLRLLLPWPELDEQREISRAMDSVGEAIQKAHEEVVAFKRVRESLLGKVLYDTEEINGRFALRYASLPPGWTLHKFGKLVNFRQLGTDEVADHGASHMPILKMADLSFGELSLDDVEYVEEHKAQALGAYLLADRDFLFNTRNTPELVGKSAVWRSERDRCLFNNNILRLRFDESLVLPEFMNLEFACWRGRRRLRALATGTTSVAAIYWQDLARIWVALPSIEYQHEAVELTSIARDAQSAAEAKFCSLRELKRSLLQNLLTGRIRLP